MMRRWMQQTVEGMTGACLVLCAGLVEAQTFSSGSTGALGAFAPVANTVVTLPPDGVLNYTTVTIPAGVTVTFNKNAANTPVTMLASGDVTVAGTINANGANGTGGSGAGPVISPGALGGPGGFPGGAGAARGGGTPAAAGQGPGGGIAGSIGNNNGNYGAPGSFVSLIPMLGGSGGGGGDTFAVSGQSQSGGSGGGGGGAIVIASSTKITVTGTITANGGLALNCAGVPQAGLGSGGAVRLVAPEVTGGGTLQALGGVLGCTSAGNGRIRLEAFTLTFNGTTSPTASTSPAPGPVTAASTPALTNVPALSISSVGGMAMPSIPTGSYSTADVSLPGGTTNPVPVIVTAMNTPVGSIFTVRVIPKSGSATTFTSGVSTGTFAVSTATANVTLPSGAVSVLNVFATVTLTAALAPEFEGEKIERVLVAAGLEVPSSLTLITVSGKEVTVDQLAQAEQVKFAAALDELRTHTLASTEGTR